MSDDERYIQVQQGNVYGQTTMGEPTTVVSGSYSTNTLFWLLIAILVLLIIFAILTVIFLWDASSKASGIIESVETKFASLENIVKDVAPIKQAVQSTEAKIDAFLSESKIFETQVLSAVQDFKDSVCVFARQFNLVNELNFPCQLITPQNMSINGVAGATSGCSVTGVNFQQGTTSGFRVTLENGTVTGTRFVTTDGTAGEFITQNGLVVGARVSTPGGSFTGTRFITQDGTVGEFLTRNGVIVGARIVTSTFGQNRFTEKGGEHCDRVRHLDGLSLNTRASRVTNDRSRSSGVDGITLNTRANRVSNNQVQNAGVNGMTLNTRSARVSNNQVQNSGVDGVTLNTRATRVGSNQVQNSGVDGVTLNNRATRVSNNQVQNSGVDGVTLNNRAPNFTNNLFNRSSNVYNNDIRLNNTQGGSTTKMTLPETVSQT